MAQDEIFIKAVCTVTISSCVSISEKELFVKISESYGQEVA